MAALQGSASTDRPRVVVLGGEPSDRSRLLRDLGTRGIDVIGHAAVAAFRDARLVAADALLVILDHAGEREFEALDALAGERRRSLMFVESLQLHGRGLDRVVTKLRASVADRPRRDRAALSTMVNDGADYPVWVLAASLGGPEMLKRFLRALGPVPGMAFIVAQHIGEGFTEVLASQLNREASLAVAGVGEGASPAPGRVHVAPVTASLDIDASGRFRLGVAGASGCAPTIDDIMTAVARRYGPRAGAIVFSGMGDDGALGCQRIADAGGTVWVQSFDTCVIDSMPRAASSCGAASLHGSPEVLAKALSDERERGRDTGAARGAH